MKLPIHLETRVTDGERLFSSSAARNSFVIGAMLETRLPYGARVLEIAGGTGEHGAHICSIRDDVIWQSSDPDAASRRSQNAWATDHLGHMLPSLDIDTSQDGWQDELGEFDAIYCANMIHIAPWDAALGLAKGAGDILPDGGAVFLYGPIQEGDDTSPSNLAFDADLKRRNLAWGVRDLSSVKHIFADAGFNNMTRIVMPKENRLLIFSK